MLHKLLQLMGIGKQPMNYTAQKWSEFLTDNFLIVICIAIVTIAVMYYVVKKKLVPRDITEAYRPLKGWFLFLGIGIGLITVIVGLRCLSLPTHSYPAIEEYLGFEASLSLPNIFYAIYTALIEYILLYWSLTHVFRPSFTTKVIPWPRIPCKFYLGKKQ